MSSPGSSKSSGTRRKSHPSPGPSGEPQSKRRKQGLCRFCEDLPGSDLASRISEKIILTKHVDVRLLNQRSNQKNFTPEEKKERLQFVGELEKQISALRNEEGGAILVHLDNFHRRDKNINSFNELVDPKIQCMIDDGSLFVDIFHKKFDCSEGSAVIVFTVQPTKLISTLNFNTKIPLDFEIRDPLSDTVFAFIKKLIQKEKAFRNTTTQIRGIEYIDESRSQQVKAWYEKKYTDIHTPKHFTDCIWNDLRLKEYISAFSKVDGGGSYYLGISEALEDYSGYKSKKYKRQGFRLKWTDENRKSLQTTKAHGEVIKRLKNKLTKETIVLKADGKCEAPKEDIIDIVFHEVEDTKYHILEVSVAAVEGVLFYHCMGPESYVLKDQKPHRLSLEDWYWRLKRALDNIYITPGSLA